MRRILVLALPVVALACSSSSPTDEGNGSGGDGATESGTGGIAESGSAGVAATSTGGVAATATGGSSATATGGEAATATGGSSATATGGSSATATGGSSATATGGEAATATGGEAATATGGEAATATGGEAGASTGGDSGAETGGSAGASGGGGEGGLATGPTVEDPTDVGAGLPEYYISNSGNDNNSGLSPDDPWETVTNIPPNEPSMVHFERGGEFTAAGARAIARNGPAAFNVPAGSVWTTYGEGDRPILRATEQNAGYPTGAVLSPGGETMLEGLSFTGQANFGLLIETDGNLVQNCEVDGSNTDVSQIQLAFSVRGHFNRIIGNYIHSMHQVILDNGDPNTSGGAEAIVVNGTDHEIAYNTITDCWTPNETLGGAEGGCLEIIAREPGEVVENVLFHHNHCSLSVGLFEACAGNFAGTPEKIQEHHAVVRNTTLAYNVVMDAMWLYLLQTANTDFDGLIFEHNTLVHGPHNTDIPQQGAPGFGNFYDTDQIRGSSCSTDADCTMPGGKCLFGGTCFYQFLAQPGTITVRNNLFVVLPGATEATMKLPPGDADVANNIFSPRAPTGAEASRVTVVADPGLVTDDFHITADSPAVDAAGQESVMPWIDFDGNGVPCGSGPDIGAVEYCP